MTASHITAPGGQDNGQAAPSPTSTQRRRDPPHAAGGVKAQALALPTRQALSRQDIAHGATHRDASQHRQPSGRGGA
jgi:hypothetical protein